MRSGWCAVAVLGAVSVIGCSDGATGPGSGPTDNPASHIVLYSGSIGLVVDTREIFRRGYTPTTVAISFTGQAAFDTVLSIDPVTDIATLIIQNDSLTASQKSAFTKGIATTIVVRDSNQAELGRLDDVIPVDDSNRPVHITTSLPLLAPPPVLGSTGAAYLLQREGTRDLVTRFSGATIGGNFAAYDEDAYHSPSDPAQQFTFVQRPDSTYRVGHLGAPDSSWCVYESLQASGYYRVLRLDSMPAGRACASSGEALVVLEQDADGWMRLKLKDTGEYVARGPGGLTLGHRASLGAQEIPNTHDQASRFRLISDDIDWTFGDRGTAFEQPILPPARVDFAYLATLTNCSSATLTETVGRSITQTTTTSFTTSESAQIFAGLSYTIGTKVGASAEIPDPPLPIPVNVNAEVSTQLQLETNLTLTHGTTIDTTKTSQEEVSRERSLQIPPFKAVTVADYVKRIDDVIVPFTQTYRVRGTYRSTGASLTGPEIITQLRFNFVQGVITRVATDYVEFTVRGEVHTDHYLIAETTVQEKLNACN